MNAPFAQIPAAGYDQQQLAAARTRMANERTSLPSVHTILALPAFGLTLLQLHPGCGREPGCGALATSCMYGGCVFATTSARWRVAGCQRRIRTGTMEKRTLSVERIQLCH